MTQDEENELLNKIPQPREMSEEELIEQAIDSIYSNQQENLDDHVTRLSREVVAKIVRSKMEEPEP